MSKIRLILTIHNNINNIEKLLSDHIEYIKDGIIYDTGEYNENTETFCMSLTKYYNKNFDYINCFNHSYINTMQYIIDNNIDNSEFDFLLLLDNNDQIINLNDCLKQVSNESSYYECVMYYSNEQFMLRNKFLISTKYNWKTYCSNNLIVNVNNDPNITGEYINNVWIKREYNYSLINYNLIENELNNPIFEKELLFAIGKYYYNQNNSKTGFMLNTFINSINTAEDTVLYEYNKELLYYCYIILTKYYIKHVEHNNVIIDTIKKAIMIYPNRAEAYSTIGNYFYKIGNYNLCYYNLEKALSLSKIDNCYMCYQNSYSIENNCNIIVASIILDKNESAFQYLKALKKSENNELYKYFICLIKNNNLLST